MSIDLMESARRPERDGRGAAVSVAVHAVIIGLAWFATAGATVVVARPPEVVRIPTYVPPEKPGTATTRTSSRHGSGTTVRVPSPTIPTEIPPITTGPITPDAPIVSWTTLVAGPNDIPTGAGSGASSGATPDGNGVYKTVDVMAEPDPRNPQPVYPSMLRDAGVEGSVSAQFVVDSMGRVDMPTITFVGRDNVLFERSVRRSLEAARFRPALVNGRAVRVLMAQTFQFRLER